MSDEFYGFDSPDFDEENMETCPRCGGAGQYHWYLGDEFNSQGWSECEICDGCGMVLK